MQIFINPDRSEWDSITKRPVMNTQDLVGKVQPILAAVKQRGDDALKDYSRQFDGVELDEIIVSANEIDAAESLLHAELKSAIRQAAKNICSFHEEQLSPQKRIETMPGVFCWRKSVGIEKVGIYIPGGTAPLFSTVLMLAIPAKIAGCKEIILCTPPQKDGSVHPAILFAAKITGVNKITKVGGAQAIAALCYGTTSVSKVFKIFGPGNQYVTAAKQLVQQEGVAIDMPAGPSEVCVLADETSKPGFVAADLLSQAEHGADSQVLLVATSLSIVQNIQAELELQLAKLPRKELASKSLKNSRVVVFNDISNAIELVNLYAAEHLIISMENASAISDHITSAGSIFLGNFSPESVGDYASGTNHTLPTNGYAAMYSGVSVDSFVKKITVQELTREGLHNISKTVIHMAEAEGLQAHANAVRVRMVNA
ncbi:MAG: histidinol dehydrogenase [Bacteroidota bacterium]